MLRPGLLLTLCIAALSACTYDIPDDPFSFAQPTRFTTRHLALDLDVDFAARRLTGSATLYMQRLDDRADVIALDTRALEVIAVSIESRTGAFRS
jgi:leukotriene-A4 hydrolase